MITPELLREIGKIADTKESHEVFNILKEHNKRLMARLGDNFHIGQTVHFLTSKRIEGKVVGTIQKINQKTCTVLEKAGFNSLMTKWNVTTSLLKEGE